MLKGGGGGGGAAAAIAMGQVMSCFFVFFLISMSCLFGGASRGEGRKGGLERSGTTSREDKASNNLLSPLMECSQKKKLGG
jgi:hypothetical protein